MENTFKSILTYESKKCNKKECETLNDTKSNWERQIEYF